MFREMRRKKQLLSKEESEAVLNRRTFGVLAVSGDDGYPYAVPLSYVYCGDKIIFHCAKTGHKLDAVAENEKVSFCVVDQDRVVPEKYTTFFRSVIVFGRARVLESDDEKRAALEILSEKYCPDLKQGSLREIEDQLSRVCVMELAVEHMTGKEAIEIVRAKNSEAG